MNYTDSLHYLNSFLNLERLVLTPANRFWNLKRMDYLLKWFQHPEKNFLPVLIAGTKGKGSTGFFLESILAESGVRAGFYSSPHLETPRERVRVQGRMISERDWAAGVDEIRRVLKRETLPKGMGEFSYFEITTLLAMLVFRTKKIRVGIFEVGMGGRLDATNILNAPICIITPVRLDHEAILGNTIAKIAAEKAAIVPQGAELVVSPQLPEALRVIQAKAKQMKAQVHWIKKPYAGKLGLTGDYQQWNAAASLKAAEILKSQYGISITPSAIVKGLKRTNWPGRWELFPGRPSMLIDGAHNPASMEALVRNLKRQLAPRGANLLIFGTSKDKKSDLMLKTAADYFNDIILTRAANPRSQEIGVLMSEARGRFQRIFAVGSTAEAIQLAKKIARPGARVVITGSFYLIGEARKQLKRQK